MKPTSRPERSPCHSRARRPPRAVPICGSRVPVPVLEVLSGAHILTDLTLGLGTVAYDYLG